MIIVYICAIPTIFACVIALYNTSTFAHDLNCNNNWRHVSSTLVLKTGKLSTGGGIVLPEPLQDDNARSWFKRFQVCCTANSWNKAKLLVSLPTLLKGHAWTNYEVLTEEKIDTYAHLKEVLLS